MAQNDNFLIDIYDKLTEIAERTASVETIVEDMKDDVATIMKEDLEQNKLIAKHIEGVRSVNARLEEEKKVRMEELAELKKVKIPELEQKIKNLETPRIFLNGLKSAAIYLTAIWGGITIIIEIISRLKK